MTGKPPIETCREAVGSLNALEGLKVAQISGWYESDPVPPSGQPPYVNGMVRLSGSASPTLLLQQLQQIENSAGRLRGDRNAARTLDLDIIAMGDLVRDGADPVLPHPRAHLREFVLRPLADVAPDWRHPLLGRTVSQLLAELGPQGVRRLA